MPQPTVGEPSILIDARAMAHPAVTVSDRDDVVSIRIGADGGPHASITGSREEVTHLIDQAHRAIRLLAGHDSSDDERK